MFVKLDADRVRFAFHEKFALFASDVSVNNDCWRLDDMTVRNVGCVRNGSTSVNRVATTAGLIK
jgi:hypothetical protein